MSTEKGIGKDNAADPDDLCNPLQRSYDLPLHEEAWRAQEATADLYTNAAIPARQAGRRSRRARTGRAISDPARDRSINQSRARRRAESIIAAAPHRSLSRDRMLGCMRLDVGLID